MFLSAYLRVSEFIFIITIIFFRTFTTYIALLFWPFFFIFLVVYLNKLVIIFKKQKFKNIRISIANFIIGISLLIIGFGSLMSYHGIHSRHSTKNIEIFNPFIVRFNGSRGFNTLEGHYMDIGSEFNPVGVQVDINEKIDKSGNILKGD